MEAPGAEGKPLSERERLVGTIMDAGSRLDERSRPYMTTTNAKHVFMDFGLLKKGITVLTGSRLAKLRGPEQGRALLGIHAKGWVEPDWRELCLPPPPPPDDWEAYERSVDGLWD